jgi:hypothetical protein
LCSQIEYDSVLGILRLPRQGIVRLPRQGIMRLPGLSILRLSRQYFAPLQARPCNANIMYLVHS